MEYRIIDADSHVNEPKDAWSARVPAKFKDRAPKWMELEGGRVGWSFDGGKSVRVITLATAGKDVTEYSLMGIPTRRYGPPSYEPHSRLQEMEYDLVQAQVLYPGAALAGAQTYSDDPELQLACIRAYNDWMHEFRSVAPEQLIGLPIAPMTGIEDLLLEWKREADRGAKGLIISSYPNGTAQPKPEDDRFWAEVEEWDYPVHIHFGFFGGGGTTGPTSQGGIPSGLTYLTSALLARIGANVYRTLGDIVYGGLFERFPKLKVVAVETGIGWIPAFLEGMDDNFLRLRWRSGVHLKQMPSELFKEHIWATFITDPVGVELRHMIGVDHIMWSTDYPHAQSDWPNSQRTSAYELRHVPEDEKRKILRDNAAGLYHLG